MKIFIEYENPKLSDFCNYLYQLFNSNNYDVTLLDNNLSLNDKIRTIENSNNSFLLSNRININQNAIEIIYPLRDNNKLAIILNENLDNVSKYYQLRSSIITNLDYYEILRDYNNQAIMIKYGDNTINNNLAIKVYQSINSYLSTSNIYVVKQGDSLYSIARNYNTTVDEIKRINNLSSNSLSIGQNLIIPSTTNIPSNNDNNTYIVKSGDSLYSIARNYNTTVDEIKRINNLSSNLLSIGQKLIIPSNTNDITYTVLKGDSLYSIATKYNTTVNKIKNDNNLTSNLLSIGQKLIIKK